MRNLVVHSNNNDDNKQLNDVNDNNEEWLNSVNSDCNNNDDDTAIKIPLKTPDSNWCWESPVWSSLFDVQQIFNDDINDHDNKQNDDIKQQCLNDAQVGHMSNFLLFNQDY